MVNQYKTNDQRFWNKWESSGAVETINDAKRRESFSHLSSMVSVKDKLKNLRQYMPKEDDLIYRFGDFLSERIGESDLVPEGFNMLVELALHDLQTGVNGFSGKPIRNNLVGYPSPIYAILRMRTPDIADAVCTPDFAEVYRRVHEEVGELAKKM